MLEIPSRQRSRPVAGNVVDFLEMSDDVVGLFVIAAESVQDFSPVGEGLARLFDNLFVGHVAVV